MTDREKLHLALQALDFYAQPERFIQKSKKKPARIMLDTGKIARVAVEKIDPTGEILEEARKPR